MSEVEILTFITKYLWEVIIVVGGGVGTLILYILKKIGNTYSKVETMEMIDLKIIPLIQSLDRHSNLIEKQTQVMEKVNDSIQLLHKDMSVVKTKVENLESRPPL